MTWNPRAKTRAIIQAAAEVLQQAEDQGFRFTLRRVFYALVSANIIANTERSYKSLSVTLDRARWEGLLPLTCIDDLGRIVDVPQAWDNPRQFVLLASQAYRSDWWAEAETKVEVWAEKQAVSGILGPLAREYGVPFLACRGYSSLTALAEASGRLDGEPADIIYVGDHDPSGIDMDRDLQERMHRLGAYCGLVRIALTPGQIEEHQLPPQPTKSTDSRAWGYSDEFEGSWELDALPAPVLVGLVRDAIEERLPPDFEERREADEAARSRIADLGANL